MLIFTIEFYIGRYKDTKMSPKKIFRNGILGFLDIVKESEGVQLANNKRWWALGISRSTLDTQSRRQTSGELLLQTGIQRANDNAVGISWWYVMSVCSMHPLYTLSLVRTRVTADHHTDCRAEASQKAIFQSQFHERVLCDVLILKVYQQWSHKCMRSWKYLHEYFIADNWSSHTNYKENKYLYNFVLVGIDSPISGHFNLLLKLFIYLLGT